MSAGPERDDDCNKMRTTGREWRECECERLFHFPPPRVSWGLCVAAQNVKKKDHQSY